jgi:Flp pilus assembly protein TadD
LARARVLIPQALRVGGDDAEALASLVFALGMLGEDREAPVRLADRALELNPGSSNVWAASGFARTNAGEPALGFEHLETSIHLDPLSPLRANILGMQGIARFAQGRIRDAVVLLKQCVQSRPEVLVAWVFLAASHGHLGEQAAGREAIARFTALTPIDMPTFTASHPDPDTRDAVLEGIALVTGERQLGAPSEAGPE